MSPHENTSGSPAPAPSPKGGIIVSASKKRTSAGLGGIGLGVIRKSAGPGAQHGKPRPPAQPKIPFQSALPVAETHPAGLAPRKTHHRGFFAGFRSRRKGRQRVMAFIVLPLAALATAAFVIWLLGPR